ncbi:MAG: hypothetical protein LIO96_06255, partial [Lachnospiraceae bacterium]|nr:hypothetical protein [Lachnospiraceae bacterium]
RKEIALWAEQAVVAEEATQAADIQAEGFPVADAPAAGTRAEVFPVADAPAAGTQAEVFPAAVPDRAAAWADGPGGHPGGPGRPGGPPPRRGFWRPFGYGYGGYGYRRGCSGCLTPFIVIIVIVFILGSTAVTRLGGSVRYALSSLRNTISGEASSESNETGIDNSVSGNQSEHNSDTGSTSQSTITREKADTGVSFSSDCILDELGWVEDVTATGKSLEDFYNATGVQPYVYFKAYDASLTSSSEKEAYAFDWYEDNIDNEGTFLFLYFAEEDADNDVGYMVYVNGYDIDSVMDEEAVEIFWNYVDEYWYSDLSTDDMLTEIFNSTADAIMNK